MRQEHRGAYPAHWGVLADAVERAAGNRCIRCGHPKGDNFEVRRACDERCSHPRDGKMRILTVHHLDCDKANDAWWNLTALCQVCHLQVQGRVILNRPWLFMHSGWFRPYVAGFYAHYYGGLNLSRAEVEQDVDRCLAMGQPWLYAPAPSGGSPTHE